MKQNKYTEQAHEDRLVGLRFLPKLVSTLEHCACFKVQRYPTSDLCKFHLYVRNVSCDIIGSQKDKRSNCCYERLNNSTGKAS